MTKQKVTIRIDDRETEDLIPHISNHEEIGDWKIDRLELSEDSARTGDIWIDDAGIIIERKTISDFASSLTSGHLPSQVERMDILSRKAYILVEGDMVDTDSLYHSNLSGESIRGYAASVMARKDIPVVFCSNKEMLVDMAVRIGRKHIEEPSSTTPIDTGSVGKNRPVTERLYGVLSGIGSETSRTLHNEFKSIENLLNASQEELEEVDGVGEKMSESIYNELRGNGRN